MTAELPTSLTVKGMEYPINYDYRDAFDAFEAYNARDLSPLNKQLAVFEIIYGDNIPPDTDEAWRQAIWFLDGGTVSNNEAVPRKTMDYKQDAPLLFSAVNRVAGREIRDPDTPCHWWTFLGYCAEISPDSPISHIIQIRHKLATGKKLEKYEQDYYRGNRHLVDFLTDDDGRDEIIKALRGE